MRRYKEESIVVRGRERKLVIDEDPGAIGYFTLDDSELRELQRRLQPITFQPSQDVPVAYHGELRQLLPITVLMAKALKVLYRDSELRAKALPPFLSEVVGDEDAVMSAVGFDFLVGRHLERSVLVEAAAFGPEFISSSIMAEFFGMKTLNDRLLEWWDTLVKPCLGGRRSLYFVTSFGNFDFTREKEHEVLIPYLRQQGVKATFGPAENREAWKAEVLYIRAGLQFPHVWQTASKTKLWPKILAGDVKVIPPLGNNFFSSKYWLPILKNPEELIRRGVNDAEARRIADHLPNVMLLNHNLLEFLRQIISPQHPMYFKGVWNYGGYGTRRVSHPNQIGKALQQIGKMPIVVEEEVPTGFLPFDPERELPDRRIEVRVKVFDHDSSIKTMPPSVRVYYPGKNLPENTLFVDSHILP